MNKILFAACCVAVLVACKTDDAKKGLTVDGAIENHQAKMIYLEKIPAATMQPMIMDSAALDKEGRFKLKAETDESTIFNLRLDQEKYPLASVINDANKISVNVKMSKENNRFAEDYTIKGSKASQQMKDFMFGINADLQKIFILLHQRDSLQTAGASDSALNNLNAQHTSLAGKIKNFALTGIAASVDPALTLFEIGFYQSTSNGTGFGLEPLNEAEVKDIITKTVAKYPSHKGVAAVNAMLNQTASVSDMPKSLVGQPAPDFTLPDVNGKEIKLSSYRGKYVLVDFWASWCGPCRQENPNVVKAYQQFKNKNFAILGVSLDRPGQKDKWLEAIADDQLTWTHVSDLQYWNSPVVGLYGIQGIPFNVLIDPAGKVIAEGLRANELMRKLEEVL